MKLRTKLTVFSILLIAAAVTVCCALILTFARRSALSDATDAGLADFRNFCRSLSDAADDPPEPPAVRRSYLIAAFRSIEGFSAYTLRHDGAYLCNNVGFDTAAVCAGDSATLTGRDPGVRHRTVRVLGTDYFVADAVLSIGGDTVGVSLARDISDVTDAVVALAVRCIVIGAAVTAVTALAMWWTVYRSMKPVDTLRAGAAELARGSYETRLTIRGKHELAELAADFNSMADAIEANIDALHERSERQQAFINDLSHELKTPVTTILLLAETLQSRRVSPDALARSLSRIHDQARWLEALSQKLMTLVMLQGEVELRPQSVASLLDAVRETTAGALHAQGMTLVTDCGIDELPMDADLMRSALVNLVVNAQKASSHGQTIRLWARDGVIAVTDQGRGIPADEADRVTEPFYVIDRSRSKKHGGAGLGLALVKRIAEAHGAALEMESAVGKGTTVRIVFPVDRE